MLLLKKNDKRSELDQQFKDPYLVVERKGPNVWIKHDLRSRKSEIWVYLNRCKRFVPDQCQLPVAAS